MRLMRWPSTGSNCSGDQKHDFVSYTKYDSKQVSFCFWKFGSEFSERHSQFEVRMDYDDILLALRSFSKEEPRAAALLAYTMIPPSEPDPDELREQFGLSV